MAVFELLPETTKDGWLEQRKGFITASDVPALLGESRWRDREAVIAEKIGRGVPFVDSMATYMGRIGEAHVLQALGELTGWDVAPNRRLAVNKDAPGLAATPDAFATMRFASPTVPLLHVNKLFHSTWGLVAEACRAGSVAVVDTKVVASKGRSKWTKEEPPQEYFGQLQAQMLVTGSKYGLLVAKVDAHEMYGYCIKQDTFYQEIIQSEVTLALREIEKLKELDKRKE